MRRFLIIAFLFCGKFGFSQGDSLKYLQDFNLLRTSLEATHPSLYRFTSKERFDHCFDSLQQTITSQTDNWSFFGKTSLIENLIMEAHASIRMSPAMIEEIQNKGLFPLEVAFLDSTLVITSTFDSTYRYLVGAEILSINYQSVNEIFYIIRSSTGSKSGDSDGFLREVLSYEDNFAIAYALFVNPLTTYRIHLLSGQVLDLKPSNPKTGEFPHLWNEPNPPVSITYDSERDIAYMKINTFARWVVDYSFKDYEAFFEDAFSQIGKKGIQNLIIDVRDNRGGDELLAAKLISYWYAKPFRINDWMKMKKVDFSGFEYLNVEKKFKSKHYLETDSGFFKKRDIRMTPHKPTKRDFFDGQVYVLSNGTSFSATTVFLSLVQSLNAAIIVGEESGGTYGVVDGHWRANFTLPHSGLKVSYPLVGHRLAVKKGNIRRGIIPDRIVRKTKDDIMGKTDSQLEFVYNLIEDAN